MKRECSRMMFLKKLKCQVLSKSVQWELFHADGQTGMTKLIMAFCNFVNATKNPKIRRYLSSQLQCPSSVPQKCIFETLQQPLANADHVYLCPIMIVSRIL